MAVMTKSEYAKHRGVSAAAVSQWLSSGRLSGDALIGEGRLAQINVEVADAMLARSLDPGQQMAQGRRPTASAEPPTAPRPAPADDHMARYQKARADAAEIEAERSRRKEQAERGLYIETAPAKDAWAKQLGTFVAALEQWVPDLAGRVAAHLAEGGAADRKSLTVLIRSQLRDFRQRQADEALALAEAAPELVEEVADTGG